MNTYGFKTKQTLEVHTDKGDLFEIALPDFFESVEAFKKTAAIQTSPEGFYSIDDLKRIKAAVETAILVLENDLIL